MVYENNPVFENDVFEDAAYTGVSTDKIFELNLSEKIIYLKSGVASYHPVDDIYKEVRYHRRFDESLRYVDMPIEAAGNIAKGGGKYTARLAILNNGWRIAPANETHVLRVTGEQITDDGQAGVDVMDMSLLDAGVTVSVEYAPPDTEIILVSVGSAVQPQDILDIAKQVWLEATRTLTSEGAIAADTAAKVWLDATRTLTNDSASTAAIAAASAALVWAEATRTLTDGQVILDAVT